MSFFEKFADRGTKITDGALGDLSPLFGKDTVDLLNEDNNRVIDAMKSLPSSKDLQNLGFPQFDDFFGQADPSDVLDNVQNVLNINIKDANGFDELFEKILANKSSIRGFFGSGANPLDRILGGNAGFENTLRSASDLLGIGSSGTGLDSIFGSVAGNGDLSDSLGGLFGKNGSGGLGDVFSGLKGILGSSSGGLGGILGGLDGLLGSSSGLGSLIGSVGKILPVLTSLLPVLLQVAPLAAAVL